MRRKLALGIAVLLCALFFSACGDPADGYVELLGDADFKNGIMISETGNETSPSRDRRDVADYMGTVAEDATPYWSLAQHECNLSIQEGEEKKEGDWYVYTDSLDPDKVSKHFKVNPKTGSVALNCDASKDYEAPRDDGRDPWAHMLLGQGFYDETLVADMDELILDISFTLTKMENMTGAAYNPGLHAAQFQLFFVVKSMNTVDAATGGLWFGMPFYDNRETQLTEPNGNFDIGTQMYISSMGNAAYMEELATVGKRVDIYHDLLENIEVALGEAQKKGYLLNSVFQDLYLVNMNIGWEIPGVFDVGVDIHNFSLKAKYKV